MKDLNKFIKSTGVFLIGNVLSKTIVFFMLPLYTKYLSPSDFGVYDLHIAYITFLSSILFLDIWDGIMRFMFDYSATKDKMKPIIAGSLIFFVSTILYSIAVFLLGNIMGIEFKGLLFLYGLLMNASNMMGYIARGYGENVIFALGGIVNTIATVFCNIVFIAVFHKGYEYLYVSSCIGLILNTTLIGYKIKYLSILKSKKLEFQLLKSMIIYAAPLSVNSMAYWFLTSYNKVVINNQLTSFENGLYAVANKFSSMINIFTQCFQMAWQELTFSKAGIDQYEKSKFYTKAINEYIQFLYLGMILVIPAIYIVFPYMIDPQYEKARILIPLALLATFLSCISSFIASICSTIKKNKYLFTTTIMGSIINIIIINLCINIIGVQAASFSLSIGFLIVVIRRLQLIKKFIDIKLSMKKFIGLSLLFSISCTIFIYGNIVLNIVSFICILCFISYIYLDKIKNIIK